MTFSQLLPLILLPLLSPSLSRAEDEYRLPDLYTLSSYTIELYLTADAFTETSNVFSGKVTVLLSFNNITDYIALHAKPEYIAVNSVSFNNTDIPGGNYTVSNVTDILKINLQSQVVVGVTYSLVIEYTGVLSTIETYGFYKSSYVDGSGTTKYLATTFFSPTYARRAFPCFDEPGFKATFDISITFPSGLTALSNSPQAYSSTDQNTGLTTVVFATTPRMSTFIIAFIVSDFTCTPGASIGNVSYQVCSRDESKSTREFALDIGPKLLTTLNNFTNYDYGRSMGKMVQVAIPDFAPNAMENWGLITYRETALLWDKNESSSSYKQSIATVMAHELAHQWFGNLVTQKWWSEVFLKEGFAAYFQFHASNEALPAWELDKQFVLEQLHPALSSDALENAQALQAPCSTPAEVSARFNTVSYNKGASILRMVHHLMGLQNFRTGLQNYITRHAFGNVEPDDVWTVLNGSVVNSVSNLPAVLNTVMQNWIIKPGFPLLHVHLENNTVVVSQARFLLSGEDDGTEWYVPVTYTTSVDGNKFEVTTPRAWIVPSEDLHISLPENYEWIILNNQQSAYYRVNYDNALWDKIRTALLKNNFDGIVELNRAQIVDDLFNLARASKIKYSSVFDTITFLSNDTSYFSWNPAFSGFSFLLGRVGEDSKLGQAISGSILDLMSTLYASVPISKLDEDDQIYTLKQVLAFRWTCQLGNENCIEDVRKLFNQYRTSGQRPYKDLRNVVYCNALRYSNDTSDWNFLWTAYSNAVGLATEQATIRSALGCTKDPNLLTQYLNKSITDGSGIRPQDALSVFSSVYSSSSEGVEVAFEFLMQNHEAIAAKYQSMNSLGNLIRGIAGRFTSQSQIDRLKNFINNGNLPDAFKVAANEALEAAESNLKWLENCEQDLLDYYGIGGANALGVSVLVTTLSVMCLIFTH